MQSILQKSASNKYLNPLFGYGKTNINHKIVCKDDFYGQRKAKE